MNNPGTEQDRTLIELGFYNVAVNSNAMSTNMATVPNQGPSTLMSSVVEHSNSEKIACPPEDQDLARKGM